MEFVNLARAILNAEPSLDAATLLNITEAVLPIVATDLNTHAGRVAFARTIPAVMNALAEDRRIVAIKELRQALSDAGTQWCGLVEAKKAIDEIAGPWRTV